MIHMGDGLEVRIPFAWRPAYDSEMSFDEVARDFSKNVFGGTFLYFEENDEQ